MVVRKTLTVAIMFLITFMPTLVFAEETELVTVAEEQVSVLSTSVGSFDELKNAIDRGEKIKLKSSIYGIQDDIYITGGKNIEIDLNDFNIYFNKGKGFVVKGATLNLIGTGTISEVVEGKGDYSPIQLFGDDNGTSITIGENITLEGWAGVMLRDSGKWKGEGNATNGNMNAILKGKIISYPDMANSCAGVYVNGNIDEKTNNIVIENTALIKASCNETTGLFIAGYAIVEINGGTIDVSETEYGTGIEIRSGKLIVNENSNIYASNKNKCTLIANGNGTTVKNAALAIVGHNNATEVIVTVNGGTFKGHSGIVASSTDEVGNEEEASSCNTQANFKNCTITSTAETGGYGIRLLDGAEVTLGNGAKVQVDDGYGVFLRGLGGESQKSTILNIEDGSEIIVTGENFAIAGNGLDNGKKYGNTQINITGGIIKSDAVAIYQPQEGSVNIAGGIISGTSGIYLKSGSLDITGGSVIGTGSQDDFEYTNNGALGNGAAVVIEVDTSSYSQKPIVPVISGGVFTSSNESSDFVISSIGENVTEDNVVKNFISGGSFSKEIDIGLLKTDGEDAVGAVLNQNGVYSYFASEDEAEQVIKESGIIGTVSNITENEIKEPFKKCIVVIDNDNGTKTEEVHNIGEEITTPTTPVKSGYNFNGWTITGTSDLKFPILISEADENILIKAKWKKKSSGGGSGGGGSGGGSSSTSKYDIKVENNIKNGELQISTFSEEKGEKVTITVIPNEGYELDKLIVKDKKDKLIELKEKSNGKFIFTMPASKVEIDVTFKKIKKEVEKTVEQDVKQADNQNKENIKETVVLTLDKKEAQVLGKTIENDVAPMIKNDRLVLPARFVIEALGGKVNWYGDKKEVLITKNNIVIKLVVGSDEALVNNKVEKLDVTAFIENDRVYLPIRFIGENLGAKVVWNNETKEVSISLL